MRMPIFDAVGFWIPTIAALLYIPKLFGHARFQVTAQIIVAGFVCCLCFLTRTEHQNGIGFLLLYYVPVVGFFLYYALMKIPAGQRVPLATICSLGYLGLAVADTVATHLRYKVDAHVGGAAWNDGLLKYLLWPYPALLVAILLGMLLDYVLHKENNLPYAFSESLIYQGAPLVYRKPGSYTPNQ